MTAQFKDKVILITGGTGSFGVAVLGRLLLHDVLEIRIFSRDEKKQNDMRSTYDDKRIKYYIGDVRDLDSIQDAMHGVDYVFHAAALKQVPSCEFYPMEAVRTNILGAENVMRSAISAKVKVCVVLSTDKAVYPINAMGVSKAMMEKIMVAKSIQVPDSIETVFCATRYGNVMGSRGSVIPLFLEQIKNDQSITVTDPYMTRFLMSLEESVDLVFYAFKNANQGDIFVQKSPASTIGDLALAMKQLFASNVDLKTIGTRHGEKLFESLVSREEMARAVDEGNFYRIPADIRGLDYGKYFADGDSLIAGLEDYTSHSTIRLNISEVKNILIKLDFIQKALA